MKHTNGSSQKFLRALSVAFAATFSIGGAWLLPMGASAADGEALYIEHCAECHQTDGSGIGFEIPGLNNALRLAGPTDKLLQWILKGNLVSAGAITESSYEMPAFEKLNDDEIAALTTYVLHQFGQSEEEIRAADVAAVRRAAPPN